MKESRLIATVVSLLAALTISSCVWATAEFEARAERNCPDVSSTGYTQLSNVWWSHEGQTGCNQVESACLAKHPGLVAVARVCSAYSFSEGSPCDCALNAEKSAGKSQQHARHLNALALASCASKLPSSINVDVLKTADSNCASALSSAGVAVPATMVLDDLLEECVNVQASGGWSAVKRGPEAAAAMRCNQAGECAHTIAQALECSHSCTLDIVHHPCPAGSTDALTNPAAALVSVNSGSAQPGMQCPRAPEAAAAPNSVGWAACDASFGSICTAACNHEASGSGYTAYCTFSRDSGAKWMVTGSCAGRATLPGATAMRPFKRMLQRVQVDLQCGHWPIPQELAPNGDPWMTSKPSCHNQFGGECISICSKLSSTKDFAYHAYCTLDEATWTAHWIVFYDGEDGGSCQAPPSPSPEASPSPSPEASPSPSPEPSPSPPPEASPSPSPEVSPSPSPEASPSPPPEASPSPSPEVSPSPSPEASPSPSPEASPSPSPELPSPSPEASPSPSAEASPSPSPELPSPSPELSTSPSPKASPSPSPKLPSPSPEPSPSPSPAASPSPSPEVSPSPSPEVSPSPSPEATPSPSPEVSSSPSPEASPSPSPEASPTPSPQVSPTPSPQVSPSPSPEASPSPSPEATPSPSPRVNVAPSFNVVDEPVVAHGDTPYHSTWAVDISSGDGNSEDLSFSVKCSSNPANLFSTSPSVSPTGYLSFTPAADAYGSSDCTVILSETGSGGLSSSHPLHIEVKGVDEPPLFTAGNTPISVDANSGKYDEEWATSISPGPDKETAFTFSVQCVSTPENLFAVLPQVNATGFLSFTPAANKNGDSQCTVTLSETQPGGLTTSSSVHITVAPVNDPPSFTPGTPTIEVLQDSGQYNAVWATDISAGPEESQELLFSIQCSSNPADLFSVPPNMGATGVLSFTPAADAYGSSDCTVTLSETGPGGLSSSHPVHIEVSDVNDPPSFTAGGTVTVPENSGQYNSTWATGISAGPHESQPLAFEVHCNSTSALFATGPAIDSAGRLTFTPAAYSNGNANCTVRLVEQVAGGLSAAGMLKIVVAEVNDPPSFTPGSATITVAEDSGTTNHPWATAISSGPGESNPIAFSVVCTSSPSTLFVANPQISNSGVLSITPTANAFGEGNCTVTLVETAAGGLRSNESSLRILVAAVNDPPSFQGGSSVAQTATAGVFTVNSWATSISEGPGECCRQLQFVVSGCTNPSMYAANGLPTVSTTDGQLRFELTQNTAGAVRSSTCSVRLWEVDGLPSANTATLIITQSNCGTNQTPDPQDGTKCLRYYPVTVASTPGVTYAVFKDDAVLKPWNMAQSVCQSIGKNLAKVTTATQASQLYTAASIGTFWIGLNDQGKEDYWVWKSDSSVFKPWTGAWYSGNPNPADDIEDCVDMTSGGKFRDLDCSTVKAYVCA